MMDSARNGRIFPTWEHPPKTFCPVCRFLEMAARGPHGAVEGKSKLTLVALPRSIGKDVLTELRGRLWGQGCVSKTMDKVTQRHYSLHIGSDFQKRCCHLFFHAAIGCPPNNRRDLMCQYDVSSVFPLWEKGNRCLVYVCELFPQVVSGICRQDTVGDNSGESRSGWLLMPFRTTAIFE
jgi:hypothetical protein